MSNFRVGDKVLYFPVKGSWDFEATMIREVLPEGIPSFPKPMVKLDGRAGYVDAAHCKPFPEDIYD
jgi:hypothetical protein